MATSIQRPAPATTRPAPIVDTARSAHVRLRPLSLTAVQFEDAFWEPRRRINRTTTLSTQYDLLESTGRLNNFRRVTGETQGEFHGRFFNDSDIYKWLEAAAWSLATHPDPELERRVDATIALVGAAQDSDGYLNTYFSLERKGERWTDLAVMHELYCAGHLFQAAVAHHRATGKRSLLDIAIRFADHIDGIFGPGKRQGACGHPEVEMALVELARETGEDRYLRLAQFFIDQHGQKPPTISGRAYSQDHEPFREQRSVVGHAVRALYLYSGAADVYAETGERSLWDALDGLWHDLQDHKIYITGGAGSRYRDEAFGEEYELPNDLAYTETCAAIANVMWNWRMLLATGEARFADALETSLYNGVLSGLSLDGQQYFYQNPLADRGHHRRQEWFGTACCPPNVARTLSSLGGYVAATSGDGLWLHLYATGTLTATLDGVGEVEVRQRTDYPWDGEIALEVRAASPATFSLFLRIPAWAQGATAQVNGETVAAPLAPGSYLELRRRWAPGDTVQLSLPMPVRMLASHPYVVNNRGRAALMRGPLVYCVEQADHPGADVWELALPAQPDWRVTHEPGLLGGVTVLRTQALRQVDAATGPLYRPFDATPPRYAPAALTAIPYYAWANRDAGPMQAWLPVARI